MNIKTLMKVCFLFAFAACLGPYTDTKSTESRADRDENPRIGEEAFWRRVEIIEHCVPERIGTIFTFKQDGVFRCKLITSKHPPDSLVRQAVDAKTVDEKAAVDRSCFDWIVSQPDFGIFWTQKNISILNVYHAANTRFLEYLFDMNMRLWKIGRTKFTDFETLPIADESLSGSYSRTIDLREEIDPEQESVRYLVEKDARDYIEIGARLGDGFTLKLKIQEEYKLSDQEMAAVEKFVRIQKPRIEDQHGYSFFSMPDERPRLTQERLKEYMAAGKMMKTEIYRDERLLLSCYLDPFKPPQIWAVLGYFIGEIGPQLHAMYHDI